MCCCFKWQYYNFSSYKEQFLLLLCFCSSNSNFTKRKIFTLQPSLVWPIFASFVLIVSEVKINVSSLNLFDIWTLCWKKNKRKWKAKILIKEKFLASFCFLAKYLVCVVVVEAADALWLILPILLFPAIILDCCCFYILLLSERVKIFFCFYYILLCTKNHLHSKGVCGCVCVFMIIETRS